MPFLLRWARVLIIPALLVLAGGCSSLKLAYNGAPQLAWWWLDGYAAFDGGERSALARARLDGWFDWHRRTQLGSYAAWLATLPPQLAGDVTPALICRLQDQARAQLEPALQRALADGAELVPLLGERQLQAIERRYAKNNAKARDEFLQPDPAERAEAAFERVRERYERFYGRLGAAQQRVLREGIAASPFDPERMLAERQRAQRDTLATLRKLVADRAGSEQRVAALGALATRSESPPDADVRAYQQRVLEHGCAVAARLHNGATAAQRAELRRRLEGWVADLRALAGDAG